MHSQSLLTGVCLIWCPMSQAPPQPPKPVSSKPIYHHVHCQIYFEKTYCFWAFLVFEYWSTWWHLAVLRCAVCCADHHQCPMVMTIQNRNQVLVIILMAICPMFGLLVRLSVFDNSQDHHWFHCSHHQISAQWWMLNTGMVFGLMVGGGSRSKVYQYSMENYNCHLRSTWRSQCSVGDKRKLYGTGGSCQWRIYHSCKHYCRSLWWSV